MSHRNGFRPEPPASQVKIHAVNASVSVACPCGKVLLLSYVTGMTLGTTCSCKRILTPAVIQVNVATGEIQVAVSVQDPKIVSPSLEDVVRISG